MSGELVNIGLAFVEGFALIISPCILPILPIILAGSLTGSKKRPLGIVVGFVLAFALFTFFSRQIVRAFTIDLTIVRNVSFALLLLLGIILLSSRLSNWFARLTQRFANLGYSLSNNQQEGFFSGIIFGALVGLIWTPCAGPILAAVIVQSVIQQTSLNSFFIVLAFAIGAAVPMLFIALLGKTIMSKMQFFKKHGELIRKIMGVIIIGTVVYMIYGDRLNLSFAQTMNIQQTKLINPLSNPYPAPEIAGVNQWINSQPLQLSQLKGKVVLIDFWAYSCINCIRTLPYLKDWYTKYHKNGFEIIGVHSPEFDFEKEFNNVKNAVETDGITYPVALDNNFVTWRNFNNSYWPAHYLIDKNGNVVYQHFGEGEYDATENNIRFLLGLNEKTSVSPEEKNFAATPETYLGYSRMENYASPEAITHDRSAIYSFPKTLDENQWALQGSWKVTSQKIIATAANATLKIHFNASKVYIVMGNATAFPIQVQLLLNGELIEKEKGKDVVNSAISVKQHTLYEVVILKHSSSAILQVRATAPGLEIYTFTFG